LDERTKAKSLIVKISKMAIFYGNYPVDAKNFRKIGFLEVPLYRLLLRDAVDSAQPPDECLAGDAGHIAVWKKLL